MIFLKGCRNAPFFPMVFKAALYEIADVLLSSVKHMSLSAPVARSEKINPKEPFPPEFLRDQKQ